MRHLAAISFAIFFSPFLSHAFTLVANNPAMQGWNVKTLRFKLNTSSCSGHSVRPALQKAVDLWNAAPSSGLKLEISGTSTATTYSSPPVVFCDSSFGTGLTNGADPDSIPGAANVNFTGNRISSGFFVLNINSGAGANIDNYNIDVLSIVMAHEMGHVLGLGHSEDSSSLMYYSVGVKGSATLAQDDINGLSYLYPRDELAGDEMLGCGSIANHIPRSGPWTFLFFLMPVAMWTVYRFRIVGTEKA